MWRNIPGGPKAETLCIPWGPQGPCYSEKLSPNSHVDNLPSDPRPKASLLLGNLNPVTIILYGYITELKLSLL